ncbi:PG0541 family transporter-associated protein [Nitrospira moscoviensis]|uniref:Nitrogen regulatory protein P-II n=1 Tax=Nitrospira moscoviensis TaxID=42253 RepID=A0A0K2GD98_NITMO|nr:PG0541 family transporter-associated protein [Nitrospira moscoviensis]ALA58913.1 hypothetical protein NITMOv2_2500 [Nitrospira moscoviensis]
MKMLLVIFRQSLDEDIGELLQELNLKAFTEAPKVLGIGEAGRAADTLQQPGFNSLILSALEDEQARDVIERLTVFRDALSRKQHGAKIPLRVFVLPCEQVI